MIRDSDKYNDNVKPNSEFLGELKEKLPEFFFDGKFNLDKFKNMLKEKNIDELNDGYQIDFIGKNYARLQSGEIPTSVIIPDKNQNRSEGRDSKNLFFTGDNLNVLRHLQTSYSNKIDMIYIDPPYNTGKKDFIYPDNFSYSDEKIKNIFGLDDNSLLKLKSIQGKSNHSAWMTFMYPRLCLMKNLLMDSGYICVSIDDNEQANLRIMMDEIFGEDNFIAEMIVDGTPKNDPLMISTSHEYVLVYVKNRSIAKLQTWGSPHELTNRIVNLTKNVPYIKAEEKLKKFYKKNGLNGDNISNYKYVDRDGVYRIGPIDDPQGKGPKDHRFNPFNGKLLQTPSGGWRCNKNTWNEWVKDNLIYFPDDESKLPSKKTYISKDKLEVVRSVQKIQTRSSTNYLKKLFGGKKIFNNPKPMALIETLIDAMNKDNPVVLDAFAGSSTTADAVMRLNAKDGRNRKFIMIQLPEKTYTVNSDGKKIPTKGGKNAYEMGYDSIDEISRDRIKFAAKNIRNEKGLILPDNFDGSFKHYYVAEPTQKTLEQIEDFNPDSVDLFNNMVDSFSSKNMRVSGNSTGEETILTTWLVKDGYHINTNVNTIAISGYTAYLVENTHLYLIKDGWNSNSTKQLLNLIGNYELNVQTIVLFGYSFNIAELRELEIGLKQLDRNVNLLKRY